MSGTKQLIRRNVVVDLSGSIMSQYAYVEFQLREKAVMATRLTNAYADGHYHAPQRDGRDGHQTKLRANLPLELSSKSLTERTEKSLSEKAAKLLREIGYRFKAAEVTIRWETYSESSGDVELALTVYCN